MVLLKVGTCVELARTVVISLPKIPYIHRIYMVLANPTHAARDQACALYGVRYGTLFTVCTVILSDPLDFCQVRKVPENSVITIFEDRNLS